MNNLNKREFLKTTALLGTAAVVPATSPAAGENAPVPATIPPATDLVDEHFASTSGRRIQYLHRWVHIRFPMDELSGPGF